MPLESKFNGQIMKIMNFKFSKIKYKKNHAFYLIENFIVPNIFHDVKQCVKESAFYTYPNFWDIKLFGKKIPTPTLIQNFMFPETKT